MVFDVRWGRSYHRVEKNAGPARRGDLAAESAGPGISLDPFWGLGGVTDCVCGNSDTNCALGHDNLDNYSVIDVVGSVAKNPLVSIVFG